jgi:hypothetical protein
MPQSEPSRGTNVDGGDAYSVEDDITAILEIGHALDAVMEALGIDPLDYTRGGGSVTDVVRAQTHAILEAIARLRGSAGARG